jgi:hypothetical protein
MGRGSTLTAFALAAGMLTHGSGCLTPEPNKLQTKKPDVTQLGVLPPPQEIMKPVSAVTTPGGAVIPAGGVQPATPTATGPLSGMSASPLTKLAARFEKKVPVSDMAVAWQTRIAYLPDPSRNGAPGPGLVGQMFLYGGPKLNFIDADGTLTVDMIDETPRPAGQKAATPERWQFNKEMLLKLRAMDETFGMSYVLFLPWPAYKPDITKVRIAARYDSDSGQTVYSPASVISIDKTPRGTPVWDGTSRSTPLVPGAVINPLPMSGGTPNMLPNSLTPSVPVPGSYGAIPLGGPQPISSGSPAPSTSLTPPTSPMPLSPVGPGNRPATPGGPSGTMPFGAGPIAPTPPAGLEPFAITVGNR